MWLEATVLDSVVCRTLLLQEVLDNGVIELFFHFVYIVCFVQNRINLMS